MYNLLCKYFKRRDIKQKRELIKKFISWSHHYYNDNKKVIIAIQLLKILNRWTNFKIEQLTPEDDLYDRFHVNDFLVQASVIVDIEKRFNISMPDNLESINTFNDLLIIILKIQESFYRGRKGDSLKFAKIEDSVISSE